VKDVTSQFPQSEEEDLQIALKFELLYTQSGYVYTVIPNFPWPNIANVSGEYHVADGIVGVGFNPV